jgi:hypothetical protein
MSFKYESEAKCSDQKATASSCEDFSANHHVIVDHLCCKICYDPYAETGEKEPKIMKCGHSICLQCAKMIYKKQRNVLMCPFCKCTDRVQPTSLPKNFDMISMIHHYPSLPPNQVGLTDILLVIMCYIVQLLPSSTYALPFLFSLITPLRKLTTLRLKK